MLKLRNCLGCQRESGILPCSDCREAYWEDLAVALDPTWDRAVLHDWEELAAVVGPWYAMAYGWSVCYCERCGNVLPREKVSTDPLNDSDRVSRDRCPQCSRKV